VIWQNYRYWLLYLCPSIRFLDFQKVKNTERDRAEEIFGTLESPTNAAQAILTTRVNSSMGLSTPATNGTNNAKRVKLTDKEKIRMETLVKNAKTLAEVARLEKDISEGRIPAGVLDSDVMDET
jgi:U2 small nuclear ribonucleoprotein A'